MPVVQYTTTKPPVLHAFLWTGNEAALVELPGLEQNDVSFWVEEDGILYIDNLDEPSHVARPHQDYVVRGVTGYFFVVEKEKFEGEYVPMEVLVRGLTVNEYQLSEDSPRIGGITLRRMPQRDGTIKWAIYDGGFWVLSKEYEDGDPWEYEPIPSSRNDEYLARCRYDSIEEALWHWQKWLDTQRAESS